MDARSVLVHVTHEAVAKIGGIGAVLHGFFTCDSYLEHVARSILVGPLFTTAGSAIDRLGEDGVVLYSSIDGVAGSAYDHIFRQLESSYNVSIVYGRRTFIDTRTGIKSSPEVLIFDIRNIDRQILNRFKGRLYTDFGIQSDLYENIWEYEQYVRLAPVAIDTLKAIGVPESSTTIIAHEFMGMPTALAAMLDPAHDFKTAFYAHEVATIRRIAEKYPGRDTMFYNAMNTAARNGLFLDQMFGSQDDYFKHPLVSASKYCDAIFAVGDYVARELRFLSPEFGRANIEVVYNGIPAYRIDAADKLRSRQKLKDYCKNLLGYSPDVIFTHVTRLVDSKGLWRDLSVLSSLEPQFRKQGKTGIMFLLSTQCAQRRGIDIRRMEQEYSWPVAHREGWPDLSGGEADFYTGIQHFNARSTNIKIVFINQFGFEARHCGTCMPSDMEFMDIRKGSDVEFGMSIYEPFGIAQLEPLAFGAICVLSSVCGCAGFVRDVAGPEPLKNVIIADYVQLNGHCPQNPLDIDEFIRLDVERRASEEIAAEILRRLPATERETAEMIESGYRVARDMGWETVVKDYLLCALDKALARRQEDAQAPHIAQLA
jgi:glycosyltransferase involved in cell wall biosynthesis